MDRKEIVILLPRGETFRNFVYTSITDALRENYRITFIAVKPNEELWKYLSEKCDELIELGDVKTSYAYGLFYEIFDLAHNRYMWSEAAKVRWNMRDAEAKGILKRIIRLLKKGMARLLANQTCMVWLEGIDAWLAQREQATLQWKQYFSKHRPSLVFNTSHSHARNAHPCIYAANALKIPTATFLFSWDNLTSQGRVLPRYSYYFAWNHAIKNDFHRIYPHIAESAVMVTGTPQFLAHYQTEAHLPEQALKSLLGMAPSEKYFLYSSGMSNHMPYEPYVVERIADKIKTLGPEYRLVVRTYAKDRADVFTALQQRRPDIIIPEVKWEKRYQTPLIEDQIVFSSLLRYCIAGINVASTISLELCMFNKPAINIAYDPPGKDIFPYSYTRFYAFDHYKPIVDSGAVELAHNEDELMQLLQDTIATPEKRAAERKNLISKFFEGKAGEQAGQQWADSLVKIIEQPQV